MFCSKCGNTLAPNTAFCQSCGAPVQASSTITPGASASPAFYPAPALPGTAEGAVSPHWLPTSRTYAGFWLRVVAYLLDRLIVGIVVGALIVPIILLTGIGAALKGFHPDAPPDPALIAAFISSIALLIGCALVLGWLYNAYFESSEWQATVGKRVLNLIVTDLAGNRISFARASGRFFSKIITSLIPLGIGYALAGFTEKKQALHDMITGCLVLRS